jgi:hypothetical protein
MEPKIFDVVQETTGKYTATIVDEDGNGISSADITTAVMTLYDTQTEDIINTRDAQDILNANGVTIDTSGNLEWIWDPEDMPILHSVRKPEVHTALIKITWDSGAKQLYHEVSFRVNKVRIIS